MNTFYIVGDLVNGVFFRGTEEAAEAAYKEAIHDGIFAEMDAEDERVSAGYAPRSEREIREQVEAFFYMKEDEE
jgi:hypothetical protein